MDVKKVRKRAAMWAGYAAFVLCCFAAGYLIAWAGNSGGASITGSKLVLTAQVIFFACLSLYLHILLHEAGHLVAGLMTGYRFVSFRIASYTLVRDEAGLHVRRFSIPGTAGQCLMMPPKDIDRPPFVLYNLGGVLANVFLSAGALICGNGVFWTMFGAVGLLLGLANGIPLKLGGIPNDGYNLLVMRRQPAARRAFAAQLRINGLLSEGKRLRELPSELFALDPAADDLFSIALRQMRYGRALDEGELLKAREELDAMQARRESLPAFYRMELDCERGYMMMVYEQSREAVDVVYGKEARAFADKAKYMLSHQRIEIAYALQCEGDVNRANALYARAIACAKRYPVSGEAAGEMELIRSWMERVN